jgi:hypothetical protein
VSELREYAATRSIVSSWRHAGAGGGIDVSNIGFGAHTTRGYSANSDNGGGTLP